MTLSQKNTRKRSLGTLVFAEVPFVLGDDLENIQECAKLYKTLLNKTFYFTLENNIKFKLFFKAENFVHIIGLHKLTDLKLTEQYSAKVLFKKLLNGEIPHKLIKSSIHYSKIQNRIFYFENIIDMLNKKNSKIIIDYDKTLVNDSKLINTKYILYKTIDGSYLMLTIGDKGNGEYPETLFFELTKKYISSQTLLDILDIEIVEKKRKK